MDKIYFKDKLSRIWREEQKRRVKGKRDAIGRSQTREDERELSPRIQNQKKSLKMYL